MTQEKFDQNLEIACQRERANWIARQYGLPTVGSSLANKFGIKWTVQAHATVPTVDTLNRWRRAEIEPEQDMYPAVIPENLSPLLTEFIAAIDRCTTKTFTILDTMPGRRKDGRVPGGNYIDTICHPATNLLFLNAARIHEAVIAHEFGHAWIQYVDECEDFRTLKSAKDPQRARLVSHIQSFVLDLKVNDLLRRKGFDLSVIEEDQTASMTQLVLSLQKGYRPEYQSESVFMALQVADQLVRREEHQDADLVRFERSLQTIRAQFPSIASLAFSIADSVTKHGYDSYSSIIRSIDECLLSSFEHCGESFDIDRELVLVDPPEPDHDKFPLWLRILPPRVKCQVGKHMARNDVSSEWSYSVEPTVTGRARVTFWSPDRDKQSDVLLHHRIGPPNRYSDLPEVIAENLAMKHRNQTGSYQLHGGPPHPASPPFDYDPRPPTMNLNSPFDSQPPVGSAACCDQSPFPTVGSRPYMAGLGRFLTAARLAEQLAGEHPYGYAFNNPTTYVDPMGASPIDGIGWWLFVNPTYDPVVFQGTWDANSGGGATLTITGRPCQTPADQITCNQRCSYDCQSLGYYAGSTGTIQSMPDGCACGCTCQNVGCSAIQVAFCLSSASKYNLQYIGSTYHNDRLNDLSNCNFSQ